MSFEPANHYFNEWKKRRSRSLDRRKGPFLSIVAVTRSTEGRRKAKSTNVMVIGKNSSLATNDELAGFVYTYDGYAKAVQFRRATDEIDEWAKQNCIHFP